MTKQELRQTVKQDFDGLSVGDLENKTINLNQNLLEYIQQYNGIWGVFSPIQYEPDISIGLEKISTSKLCFPKIEASEMVFYKPRNQSEDLSFLKEGKFGIKEPDIQLCEPVNKDQISVLLVPGLSFGKDGRRLGRGKGFYDRFLRGYQGVRIGVCLEMQLKEGLPVEAHDQSVDCIVTESQVYNVDTIQQSVRHIERIT